MLLQNLSLIDRRWPELAQKLSAADLPDQLEHVFFRGVQTLVIDGIQFCSRYAPQHEARLQASLIPAGHEIVYVYGLANGDLIRDLLARQEVMHLHLILMNTAIDRANFSFFDHSDWLADPRVNILNTAKENELRPPFACASAFLYLADDASSRLRDLLCLELSTPYIRRYHSSREAEILLQLDANETFVAQDGDVADLLVGNVVEFAVVAAAGPTLFDQLAWMKEHRHCFRLIAVDAAVRTLIAAGIAPDYVLSVDSAPTLFELFFDGLDLRQLADTGLVYSPLVNGKILEAWPGKRFAAYANHPIYSSIDKKYPRGKLFSSGSVLHPALDLAVKMRARNIVLAGADFSFTKGQSHVRGSRLQLELKTNINCWVLNSKGDRVPSSRNYVGYLRDLERYIAWHPEVNFFNASQEGACIEAASSFNGETYPWR